MKLVQFVYDKLQLHLLGILHLSLFQHFQVPFLHTSLTRHHVLVNQTLFAFVLHLVFFVQRVVQFEVQLHLHRMCLG